MKITHYSIWYAGKTANIYIRRNVNTDFTLLSFQHSIERVYVCLANSDTTQREVLKRFICDKNSIFIFLSSKGSQDRKQIEFSIVGVPQMTHAEYLEFN